MLLPDPVETPVRPARRGKVRSTPKRRGGSKPPFPKHSELKRRRRRERQARRAMYRARRR